MKLLLGTTALVAILGQTVAARAPGARSQKPTGSRLAAAPSLAPLTSEPEEYWNSRVLAFESEPLVCGSHVLVNGRDPTGRRALAVLDAQSGRLLSRTLFPATHPLGVAFAGERVAVRTGANRVDLFRLRVARLLLERSFLHLESISAPCLEGDELLLREGDELVRHDLTRRDPTWRAKVPGAFHGAPAARGDAVFAGWYEANGTAHLAWIERASGRILGDLVLGRHVQGPVADRDALEIVAHGSQIFVRLPPGLPAASGRVFEWTRVRFDGTRLERPTLHDYLAAPLETQGGWVVPERASDGSERWILGQFDAGHGAEESERVIELASAAHHAWLAACRTPAERVGEVLYLGPCAADERSLEVLWRRPVAPAFRPVPLDGGLLLIEDGTLRRFGSSARPADPGRERALQFGLERERALGERLALLASKALRNSEVELAARLAAEAEGLGASGRTLQLVRAEAEGGRTQPGGRNTAHRAALAAEEQAARTARLDELAGAARTTSDPRQRHALLGQLFELDPDHRAGLEVLQRELPAPIAPGESRSWLEFLEVSATCPIERVQAAPAGATPSAEQRRLEAEQTDWRPDVVGYRSARLLVVTAGASPAAVAHTLRAGELVCDGLERLFGSTREGAERMELVLYPTRDEYLAHSGTDLGGLETVLGFTAGHFDLSSRTSRLFLPDGDEDDARLLDVSVHELTHHWLATRSPFGSPRSTTASPGFWVVEAIATWAEELRLDPARGAWRTDPLRAPSLDTLRNAAPEDLLSWSALFAASFEDYTKLESRPTCSIDLDWQLGAHAPRSPLQLFYAQGGALLHYLHEAEAGRHRPLFLAAIAGFYGGQPLDVAARLGVGPEELGARVRAWARGR